MAPDSLLCVGEGWCSLVLGKAKQPAQGHPFPVPKVEDPRPVDQGRTWFGEKGSKDCIDQNLSHFQQNKLEKWVFGYIATQNSPGFYQREKDIKPILHTKMFSIG